MRILHIIAGNLAVDGAAKGAYWLHLGLKNIDVESKIFTNSDITFDDKDIITTVMSKKEKLLSLIKYHLDSLPSIIYTKRKKFFFSTSLIGYDFTKTNAYKEADIIHLHWINGGFINIKDLAKIDKPIVWTIRDMWPMTGGCHYSLDCEKFKTGCGTCDQLNSNKVFDLSRFVLKRKKKYLPKSIRIVGISNWLSNTAKESKLFESFEIKTIHNNINIDDFFPIEKSIAKKILGINTGKKIILAGGTSLDNFYKGFGKYLEAIKILDQNKYYLCFFGNLNTNLIDKLGFEYKNFGFLNDSVSLRLLYSASDVFIAPSIMDAFGKTIAEAMSCGTPVVCFDATGPKDIVTHKKDGYKAKPFQSEDLANGMNWILNCEKYNELSQNARNKVLKEFDASVIAKKYKQLYCELLNKRDG